MGGARLIERWLQKAARVTLVVGHNVKHDGHSGPRCAETERVRGLTGSGPHGFPADPTVRVRWFGAKVALPTVEEVPDSGACTRTRRGGAKMRLGDVQDLGGILPTCTRSLSEAQEYRRVSRREGFAIGRRHRPTVGRRREVEMC